MTWLPEFSANPSSVSLRCHFPPEGDAFDGPAIVKTSGIPRSSEYVWYHSYTRDGVHHLALLNLAEGEFQIKRTDEKISISDVPRLTKDQLTALLSSLADAVDGRGVMSYDESYEGGTMSSPLIPSEPFFDPQAVAEETDGTNLWPTGVRYASRTEPQLDIIVDQVPNRSLLYVRITAPVGPNPDLVKAHFDVGEALVRLALIERTETG